MTERQMIQEILNTVDVIYSFVNTDDDKKEYEIIINRQDGDHRPLENVNKEIKHYFTDATLVMMKSSMTTVTIFTFK